MALLAFPLMNLPKELIEAVVIRCSTPALFALSQTNKYFRGLCVQDDTWRPYLVRAVEDPVWAASIGVLDSLEHPIVDLVRDAIAGVTVRFSFQSVYYKLRTFEPICHLRFAHCVSSAHIHSGRNA